MWCQLGRVWSEVKALSQYEARSGEIKSFNAAHKHRKRGIALIPVKFGIAFTARFLNQAGALVHVYSDGSVLVTHGGVEMGQGLHTKMAMIAARALGVPLDKVVLLLCVCDW